MKKQRMAILVGLGSFAPQALASFSPSQLIEATKIAVSDFETTHPDHVSHLSGFKTWKSGLDGKVKIYVDHDGHAMEFDYTCQDHGGTLECVAN